jgi:hypothetical protein
MRLIPNPDEAGTKQTTSTKLQYPKTNCLEFGTHTEWKALKAFQLTPVSPSLIVKISVSSMMMETGTDTQDFVRPEIGREVAAIGGHYFLGRQIRLLYSEPILDKKCSRKALA